MGVYKSTPMDHNSFLNSLFTRALLVALIAILVTLFLWQALQIVKPSPKYENFCSQELLAKDVSTETSCVDIGGKWEKAPAGASKEIEAYCNPTFSCQKQYDAAAEEYSGFAFIILISTGLILGLAGFLIRGSLVVTNGLLSGGVLTIFTSSVGHWSYLYPWAKVLLLGVALAAVLYGTWYKFKD
jgi:hypothetical protein